MQQVKPGLYVGVIPGQAVQGRSIYYYVEAQNAAGERVHGHGTAHPRRIGMACQIGLDFDLPTIGCARKLLSGAIRPVGETRGSSQPILLKGREVGLAYRSKDRVKPIFISPGYKCDLPFALDIIVKCLRGYRLPEPLRIAHLFANKYKRYNEKKRKSSDRDISEET